MLLYLNKGSTFVNESQTLKEIFLRFILNLMNYFVKEVLI